jgi:hypothetical protein
MPQLDLMTFFTQFFWFSLGFSFFYIFLLHFVMPVISLNLKFRKKRLDILANDINKKKEGALNLLTTYDNVLLKALNFSRLYVTKTVNHGNSWIQKTASEINSAHFSQSNVLYIKSLGVKGLNLVVLESGLKTSTTDKNWTKLWK